MSATDTSTITATANAVSFAAAIGLGGAGAISLSFADNTIDNDVEAYATLATIKTTASTADLVITATENATVTSTATASAVAVASIFSGAVGSATSDATVTTTTRAYADPVELDVKGNVEIDAIVTAKADATTTGAAVSVALVAVSSAVTEATAMVTPTVESCLGGYTGESETRKAQAGGTISVGSTLAATATALVQGSAISVSIGGANASPTATAKIQPNAATPTSMVKASISGGNVGSTAGGINVKAIYNADPDGKVVNGTGAQATAYAASGSMVGNAESTATANDKPYLNALVDSDATLDAAGTITISTMSATSAISLAAGKAGGLVGFGASHALSTAQSNSEAYVAGAVGSLDETGAANLVVSAYSADDAQAASYAVSGGLVANSKNDAAATASPVVKVYLGADSIINATGNIEVEATADPEADASTYGVGGGFVKLGGSVSNSTVEPDVDAYIGTGAIVLSGGDVTVEATVEPQSETSPPAYIITLVDPDDDTLTVDDHGLLTGTAIEYENGSNTTISGLDGRTESNVDPTCGNWASGTSYSTGDVVMASDGKTYAAKSNHTSADTTNPALNTTVSNAVWERASIVDRRVYNIIVTGPDTFQLGSLFQGEELTGDDGSGINSEFDTIRFASAHNFEDGDIVRYEATAGATSVGLGTSQYYVQVIDGLTIRLLTEATPVEKVFTPGSTDASTNTITTTTNHGYTDGQAVRYDAPDPTGFVNLNVDVHYTGTNDEGGAVFENVPGADNIYFTDDDFKRIAHGFEDGDEVVYTVEKGVAIGGLEDGRHYWIANSDTYSVQLKRTDMLNEYVYYVRGNGSNDQIVLSDGNTSTWADAGFRVGEQIVISNSDGNNNTYTISAINGATLTLSGAVLHTITRVDRAMTLGYVDIDSGDGVDNRVTLTLSSGTWAGMGITSGTIELANLGIYSGGTATIQSVSGGTIRLNTVYAGGSGTYADAYVQRPDPTNDTFGSGIVALTPDKAIRVGDQPLDPTEAEQRAQSDQRGRPADQGRRLRRAGRRPHLLRQVRRCRQLPASCQQNRCGARPERHRLELVGATRLYQGGGPHRGRRRAEASHRYHRRDGQWHADHSGPGRGVAEPGGGGQRRRAVNGDRAGLRRRLCRHREE